MRKLSIIVPMHNERENILILYSEITQILKNVIEKKLISNYEIIFVNDGSRDGSLQIFKELSEKDKGLKIINLRKNFGQTSALKAGFDKSVGDIIITMDGDLQNDPRDIPRLIKKLDDSWPGEI